MKSIAVFVAASIPEITGCFAFWGWMRLGYSSLWLIPGMASLALFAYLLTLAPSDAAGRAYAAYGGVYIASSLLWLWIIEGQRPDRWHFTGAAICLAVPPSFCSDRALHKVSIGRREVVPFFVEVGSWPVGEVVK